MTEINDEIKSVIDSNKDKNYQMNKLKERIDDSKESISVLSNAIACGFLTDNHSLILQKWIVEYQHNQEQMETHLTEMQSHE
tara:strand:- start:473 stop:718 length:246 start_codon:yes stop_codon:yes gene_type:complete